MNSFPYLTELNFKTHEFTIQQHNETPIFLLSSLMTITLGLL